MCLFDLPTSRHQLKKHFQKSHQITVYDAYEVVAQDWFEHFLSQSRRFINYHEKRIVTYYVSGELKMVLLMSEVNVCIAQGFQRN